MSRNFVYFSTVTPKNGFKKDKSVRTCRPTDVFSRAFLRNAKGMGKKAQKDMDGERRVWNLTRLEEDLLIWTIWDWFNVCEASAFSWALETRKVRHQLSCYQVQGSYLFPERCHLFSWFSMKAALDLFCKRVLLFSVGFWRLKSWTNNRLAWNLPPWKSKPCTIPLLCQDQESFKSGWGLYGYLFNNKEDAGYVSLLYTFLNILKTEKKGSKVPNMQQFILDCAFRTFNDLQYSISDGFLLFNLIECLVLMLGLIWLNV